MGKQFMLSQHYSLLLMAGQSEQALLGAGGGWGTGLGCSDSKRVSKS